MESTPKKAPRSKFPALLVVALALVALVFVIWRVDSAPSTNDAYASADTIDVVPDCLLYTSSPAPETPLLGRNASARILQLTLLDAFFVSVAQLNIEQANINMQKTGAIVDFFSPGALK